MINQEIQDLKNKVAIVTGAAKGYKNFGPSIGSAIAKKLAMHGAIVIAMDIQPEAVAKTVKEIVENGGKAESFLGSVRHRPEMIRLKEMVEKHYDKVAILVNCAATYEGNIFNSVVETTEADWMHVFDVNLHGYSRMARYIIPLMQKTESGSIINISSMAAHQVTKNFAAYPVTKAAINGLTRVIAADFAPEIRCNAICPGFVAIENSEHGKTKEEVAKWHAEIAKSYPLKRVCNVEEIANVAYFLASDLSSYITGQCLQVDGGKSIIDTYEYQT